MNDRVCPYLRTFDDPNRYVSRADEANACYSTSTERPAYIPLDFQDSTCLGSDFARCSRYKSAGKAPIGRRERQLLILSAGLGGLLLIATCVFLSIMGLTLGSVGGLLGGGDSDTPTVSTDVALASTPTPTPTLTNTLVPTVVFFTPTPTSSPTPSSTATPSTMFTSPIATPTSWATPTHTPLPWTPPPTNTPWPTNTSTRVPSATPGVTGTPTMTPTKSPTPIPTAGCRTDDTMVISPTVPYLGQEFGVEVCSQTPYTDVSLTGAGSPEYRGLKRYAAKVCWKWRDSLDNAGTYTYSFKINGGLSTCKTATLTIAAPTNTPTVTPTPTPYYDLEVVPIGNQNPYFAPGQQAVTDINLRNKGNVADTFVVWLVVVQKQPQDGWTLQYCIGDTCYDYTTPNKQVQVPAQTIQALHIKFVAPTQCANGDFAKVTITVQSMGNPGLIKSSTAQATITGGPNPTATGNAP